MQCEHLACRCLHCLWLYSAERHFEYVNIYNIKSKLVYGLSTFCVLSPADPKLGSAVDQCRILKVSNYR